MSHDFGHLPSNTKADIQVFAANSKVANEGWSTWSKPRGVSMVQIFALAGGGGGGNAVAGAASTAAGGGGGATGGQTTVVIPAIHLPDLLYLSIGVGGAATLSGVSTRVSISPDNTTNNSICLVNNGNAGGNAVGATAGAAGSAGGASALSTGPLSGLGFLTSLAGQNGIIGGTTVPGAALSLPTTGLVITGGAGGGGLPAANTAGSAGGGITGAGVFPTAAGGAGGTTAPTAGSDGSAGMRPLGKLLYFYGGTGGGSSGLTVTPTGSNGGNGGNGAIGCGGGGGGGAFTASTAGVGGRGGDGIVVIVAW